MKFFGKILAASAIGAMLFGCCFFASGCGTRKPTPDITPHLLETADDSPVRPSDSFPSGELSDFSGEQTDEQYRARVDELYSLVVDEHKKPNFRSGDPVKAVYDGAIAVLDRYVANSWRQNEKVKIVHSFHDYLITQVEYDFELYNSSRNDASLNNNPAFHIDGVFLNKRAVCDGLSRAMIFLCALENIECMRVTGRYGPDGFSEPHAWNKVKLDDGKWYNVDVTADAANYELDGKTIKRQLSHGFFLVSDDTMRTFRPRLHIFDLFETRADATYDYFDDKTVRIGEELFPQVVTNSEILDNIFDAIASSDRAVGKIELKLSFEGKRNVNDADMYAQELKAAYSKIKDFDFVVSDDRFPYFQYPNGVYVLLFYR